MNPRFILLSILYSFSLLILFELSSSSQPTNSQFQKRIFETPVTIVVDEKIDVGTPWDLIIVILLVVIGIAIFCGLTLFLVPEIWGIHEDEGTKIGGF